TGSWGSPGRASRRRSTGDSRRCWPCSPGSIGFRTSGRCPVSTNHRTSPNGSSPRASTITAAACSWSSTRTEPHSTRPPRVPAAVARRTTFSGASYLSSIGTDPAFRGQGLGRLVTSIVVGDALRAGSRWIYLGVFQENDVAQRLYASLGFDAIGGVAPDLLLRP